MNKDLLKNLGLINTFDYYVTINYEGVLAGGRKFTAKTMIGKSVKRDKNKIEGELKAMLIDQGKKVKTVKIISFTEHN